MFTTAGERHADLLDQGINIIGLFPPSYFGGLTSHYSGPGDGRLILEQSPHAADNQEIGAGRIRLSIIGAVGGMAIYGDESDTVTRTLDTTKLPNGTTVQLRQMPWLGQYDTKPLRLPPNALAAFEDISAFVRTLGGEIASTELYTDTTAPDGVRGTVRGMITSNEMQAVYEQSLEHGRVTHHSVSEMTEHKAACHLHSVLTSQWSQPVSLYMSDLRPESQAALFKSQGQA